MFLQSKKLLKVKKKEMTLVGRKDKKRENLKKITIDLYLIVKERKGQDSNKPEESSTVEKCEKKGGELVRTTIIKIFIEKAEGWLVTFIKNPFYFIS